MFYTSLWSYILSVFFCVLIWRKTVRVVASIRESSTGRNILESPILCGINSRHKVYPYVKPLKYEIYCFFTFEHCRLWSRNVPPILPPWRLSRQIYNSIILSLRFSALTLLILSVFGHVWVTERKACFLSEWNGKKSLRRTNLNFF